MTVSVIIVPEGVHNIMKQTGKMIFINGKIFTSDRLHPYADCMAVEDGGSPGSEGKKRCREYTVSRCRSMNSQICRDGA